MAPNQLQHNLEYASPVIRAPSPTSTIGTTYGEDETSFSDSEHMLTQSAFETKCIEGIALALPRKEEEVANSDPLLARPVPGSHEEHRKYLR